MSPAEQTATSPLILVGALTSLLSEALDGDDVVHLADAQFRDDLRVLTDRVESELVAMVNRSQLHVAR